MHVRPVLKKKKSFGFSKEKKAEADGGHLVQGKAEQVKQDARIYATGNKVGYCEGLGCPGPLNTGLYKFVILRLFVVFGFVEVRD